ncbi:MAG: two-component regulator propeller domain-containing protein, partial [Bacteroides sp.]
MRLRSHFAFLFAILTTQITYAEPILRDTSIYVHFYGVDEGLPHPDVYALFRDSFGLLWIGTKGGGLSCFTSSRFFNFAPNPTNPDSLNCGNIHDIAEDPVHNIWLVTQKGLTCYNRTFMRFENYEIDYYARDSIHYQGGLALGFDPQG